MWISIMEADAGTPAVGATQWLWSYSTYPSPFHAARSISDGIWGASAGDMAFALYGEVVPVPGAALLGVLGLGFAGWRLKREGTP
jgi:hypothetical protein